MLHIFYDRMNGEFHRKSFLQRYLYRSVSTLYFYYNVKILPADDKDERVNTKRREIFSFHMQIAEFELKGLWPYTEFWRELI